MKQFFLSLFLCLFVGTTSAQEASPKNSGNNYKLHTSPKLVVGIVVDQMRYDYITRFWEKFGEDGFKKLVEEGFNCKNNHFNYIPTYTGPGHASVYTGATPETHGIISNNWYNKFEKQDVYCAGDPKVEPVGTSSSAGKMSPHRMITTTVTDANRLHTQLRGKTIGVALKDRGSILPAGHTANAAYWFHGKDEGVWISSSYYMEKLPKWVEDFNKSNKAESYLKTWDTYNDIETYVESGNDINIFEGGFRGKETAGFPYDLKALQKQNGGFDILKATPFGNDLTTDFAIAAIVGESLGQDEITDFLTLSYSSTDYVGHNFGVNSKEVEDTYIRLDQDIARILAFLDEEVGKGNFTIFLTADHGGGHVPAYLSSLKVPAGYFDYKKFRTELENFVSQKFGAENLFLDISNDQIFFDYETLAENEIDAEELEDAIAQFSLQYDNIYKVFTRSQLEATNYTKGISSLVDNGFNQKRSGDVVFVLEPSVISYSRTGSTHGSGENYDTHVPLIFYGAGIKKGSTVEETHITDIAPTISALLGISFPNGATGNPLEMVIQP
ncbi:MAG TPA: alkaline phosphatase PafA [Salinimicrobium sp.]|nr:alkaline phosphatase PafA [Salinimicrobium sp.]